MSARHFSVAAVALVALTACPLKAPPDAQSVRNEAMPGVKVPAQWTGGDTSGTVASVWLASFADPKLDALVAEAMQHNPDLRVAAAQVEVASAYARLADSTLWPQVNLMARGGGSMSGDSSGMKGAGIIANWELDLWGRVRAGKAAYEASYASAAADAEYARQSIAALVAKSYFLAIEAGQQQKLAEQMVASAEQLSTLAEQRQRVGKGDGYDAALSRAGTETYRDAAEQFKLARVQALRALEALLGRYPSAEVDVAATLPPSPGPVAAGLPSELLERRPDVIAAERRVAAAFYGVEEAKAARLPRISLTGSVNDISSDLFLLKERDNPVWSAGASLLQPLFTGGALKTQVEIRTAQQKQAVAEYGRIGARSFGEVENALSADIAAQKRRAMLARAAAENEGALGFTQVRYKVGSGDLRGVQQQQIAVYASQSALTRVQTEQLVQRVNLFLALGGGFDAAAPKVAMTAK
jgi:NodT family efflux transporter outer membrane factor (OMF) lipoprotein